MAALPLWPSLPVLFGKAGRRGGRGKQLAEGTRELPLLIEARGVPLAAAPERRVRGKQRSVWSGGHGAVTYLKSVFRFPESHKH